MIDNLDCSKVRELISNGGQLIDVRTPFEFKQGAIKGAVNLPIDSLQNSIAGIDKNRPVMLYCRTGARSGMVKEYLRSLGYENVFNIGSYINYATC